MNKTLQEEASIECLPCCHRLQECESWHPDEPFQGGSGWTCTPCHPYGWRFGEQALGCSSTVLLATTTAAESDRRWPRRGKQTLREPPSRSPKRRQASLSGAYMLYSEKAENEMKKKWIKSHFVKCVAKEEWVSGRQHFTAIAHTHQSTNERIMKQIFFPRTFVHALTVCSSNAFVEKIARSESKKKRRNSKAEKQKNLISDVVQRSLERKSTLLVITDAL